MLHYFYLTSFMWMGIEGYHVYQSFVRIFDRSVPLKWFYVISYGEYDISKRQTFCKQFDFPRTSPLGVSVVIVGSTTLAITLKNDVNNDVVVDVDDDVVVDVDDDVVVDLDGDANAKRLRSFRYSF